MFLDSKTSILAAIERLRMEQPDAQPLCVAVAFWGEGSQSVICDKPFRIICNLVSGGTNPKVVRDLLAMDSVTIRHLPNLHAKVIVGESQSVVGSANFSSDGLGLGAAEGGWTEAAALIDSKETRPWFDRHWREAREITPTDIAAAERAWSRRQRWLMQDSTSKLDVEKDPPELDVNELLEPLRVRPDGKGNFTRMARSHLKTLYFEKIEPKRKNGDRIPAYAANIICTQAGHRVETRDGDFRTPEDVLGRATRMARKYMGELQRFIELLAADRQPQVSDAVRYWANEYLRTHSD